MLIQKRQFCYRLIVAASVSLQKKVYLYANLAVAMALENSMSVLYESLMFTDDTVMTLAVAKWLTIDQEHTHEKLVECMKELG